MVPVGFHDFFGGCATIAGLVLVLYREHQEKIRRADVSMLIILLALYGLQLASSVQLNASPRDVSGISHQGVLLIGFFLFGIARSWQLVGARDINLASTMAAIIQRPAGQGLPVAEGEQAESSRPAAGQDDP